MLIWDPPVPLQARTKASASGDPRTPGWKRRRRSDARHRYQPTGGPRGSRRIRRGIQGGRLGSRLRRPERWHLGVAYCLALAAVLWLPHADPRLRPRTGVPHRGGEGGRPGQSAAEQLRTTVIGGAPAQRLVEASAYADLLVVGSRGHGGFSGLLLGSVSGHCAHHAHCPVVVVRPADLDRESPHRP